MPLRAIPLVPVHDNGHAGWVALWIVVAIVVVGAIVGLVRR